MSSEWEKAKAVNRDRGIGGPGQHRSFEKPKNIWSTLKRLLKYLSAYRLILVVAVVMIIISAVANIAGTWYLKPMINGLVVGADLGQLAGFIAQMAVIYILAVITSYVSSLLMVHLAQKTTNRIRADLFNHMQDLPLRFFDSKSHGELMSRFTNDVDNVNLALEQSLAQSINSGISVVGTFIMMLVLSPILTILVVLMLIIMLWIIKVVGGRSSRYFRSQQKSLGDMNGLIEEMMEGQKVVKVFNYENQAKSMFAEKNEAMRRAATDAQTFAGILMPIMGNLSYVHYALTAMGGAILAIRGLLDIGSIAVFLQYTRSFSQPITQIANQFNTLLAALAGAERIFELLDEEPETDAGTVRLVRAVRSADGRLTLLKEENNQLSTASLHEKNGQPTQQRGEHSRLHTAPLQQSAAIKDADPATPLVWAWQLPENPSPEQFPGLSGHGPLIELKGEINFAQVVFGYRPEQEVLKKISLYAKPGQKIAFVGSTGAGKTTITNLINRFYDIRDGLITYDGIDINQINKQDLRRTLGMVLQDVHLFRGSIRENIRYGKLDATDEEIIQAAKIANAHSFIAKLPDGYDTLLEPDGTNLSQGQRQLLSIARAAVADPPVLILDEATSSIDTRTERLIEQGMDRLMHGRTTFAIAHRLSTVRHSNAIMVLEDGKIIERGDHDDLLQMHGRYYRLCTGISELE